MFQGSSAAPSRQTNMGEDMNIELAAVAVRPKLVSWGEWWELWGDEDGDATAEISFEFDVE
jgi:hypothetical protein